MPISTQSPFTMDQTTFANYAAACFQAYPLYAVRTGYFNETDPNSKTLGVNVLGAMMYDQFGPDIRTLETHIAANLATWQVPPLNKDRTNDWVSSVIGGWGEDYFDEPSVNSLPDIRPKPRLNFVTVPPGYFLGRAARAAVKAAAGVSLDPNF